MVQLRGGYFGYVELANRICEKKLETHFHFVIKYKKNHALLHYYYVLNLYTTPTVFT